MNQYYNSIRTLRGEFIQIGPDESQLSEGAIYMSRPGKVRFEYYPPSQLLVVSNGNLVEVNNPAARTLDQYPLARTPLAALLASYTDLSAEANIRDVVLDTDLISVVLTQAEDGGWLTLYFDRATYELRQWITIDPQGNTITFVVYNIAVNVPVADNLFQITVRDTPGE